MECSCCCADAFSSRLGLAWPRRCTKALGCGQGGDFIVAPPHPAEHSSLEGQALGGRCALGPEFGCLAGVAACFLRPGSGGEGSGGDRGEAGDERRGLAVEPFDPEKPFGDDGTAVEEEAAGEDARAVAAARVVESAAAEEAAAVAAAARRAIKRAQADGKKGKTEADKEGQGDDASRWIFVRAKVVHVDKDPGQKPVRRFVFPCSSTSKRNKMPDT